MPVSIAPSTLPLFVPAELATRPIGGRFALTVEPGEPCSLEKIAGYILVRVLRAGTTPYHYVAEAVYDGASSYAEAIADCHRARLDNIGGDYRRLIEVSTDGTYF